MPKSKRTFYFTVTNFYTPSSSTHCPNNKHCLETKKLPTYSTYKQHTNNYFKQRQIPRRIFRLELEEIKKKETERNRNRAQTFTRIIIKLN